MKILTNTDYDFDIWYKTPDPIFTDITARSRVPDKWANYQRVLSGKYRDSIIKPINKYVEALYPAPRLISIDDNVVTLRQHNHAEIFLLKTDNDLKALDRPWIRQFYKSELPQTDSMDCFPNKFVAYVPWFIDEDTLFAIKGISDSPFSVDGKTDLYRKIPASTRYVEPLMVPFKFRKVGNHMVREGFGKIKVGTPMFDIVFPTNDTIIEKIRNFYEQN